MKIGLIDVDGHNFPNLALMRISSYHKAHGDNVEWYSPFTHYNLVYMSKVFSFSQDYEFCINADKVIRGGQVMLYNLLMEKKSTTKKWMANLKKKLRIVAQTIQYTPNMTLQYQ